MADVRHTVKLTDLFDSALDAVTAHSEQINALDGFNGNHGDNMVENMRMVKETIATHNDESPSEALRFAGEALAENGRGGTSQYYAKGLLESAEKLKGHDAVTRDDGVTLLETLMGAIPTEGLPGQGQSSNSILDVVLNMAGSQKPAPEPEPEPEPEPASPLGGLLGMVTSLAGGQQAEPDPEPESPLGGLLGMVTGLVGGQQAAPEPEPEPEPQTPLSGLLDLVAGATGGQPAAAKPEDDGLDLGDVVAKLLPAGLAYLQAKQSGSSQSTANMAFLQALLTAKPSQAQTPREAAGTVIAQGIMQALLAR